MNRSAVATVLEAGQSATDPLDYERSVLSSLSECIPSEQAFFVRHGRISEYARSFDERVRRDTVGRFQLYARELEAFGKHALGRGAAAVDREFFGQSGLERLTYFGEVMRPHRGKSSLIGYLTFREQLLGCVVLGRASATFSVKEQATLRAVLPALSLCDAAIYRKASPSSAVESGLSLREREILGYLSLGYTNREIALACGTAPKTVRNQLSAVFRKLGASTRTEAVAISLGRL
jgi:DNA-binding CsgD family transcriptional regulator